MIRSTELVVAPEVDDFVDGLDTVEFLAVCQDPQLRATLGCEVREEVYDEGRGEWRSVEAKP